MLISGRDATLWGHLKNVYPRRQLIDGIQYSGATVAFLGPTYRFLCFYGVLPWDSDVLMF